MSTARFDHLKERIRTLAVTTPPPPWRSMGRFAVGGLRAVGFERDTDLLLVVSSQGRGVFDCLSGERIARDGEEYYEDGARLEAEGIGPLQGRTIRICGLQGGGLPIATLDGWSIERVALNWPREEILLVEPGSFLYDSLSGRPVSMHKIDSQPGLYACGFSSTGRSLIVATGSDITVFCRDETDQRETDRHEAAQYGTEASARDAALAALERWYAAPGSDSLRAAIAAHGGAEIGGVRLYAADEVIERNLTYETQLYCPGYVTIGDDGGGRAIVVHGALDPPTVFVVGHGSMSEDDFVAVGVRLREWIDDGCPTE